MSMISPSTQILVSEYHEEPRLLGEMTDSRVGAGKDEPGKLCCARKYGSTSGTMGICQSVFFFFLLCGFPYHVKITVKPVIE